MSKIGQIKKHFMSGKSLSHMEATGLYRTHRLAAFVHTLKKEPHNLDIKTERRTAINGDSYVRYSLVKKGADGKAEAQ